MRRFLMFALFWGLVLLAPVHAQKNRVGMIVGVNSANFNLDTGALNSRVGLAIGGIFDFVIDARTAVRVAPVYLQKGAKQNVVNDPTFGDALVTFKGTYFEIPALLKYGAYAGLVRPYFLVGPSIGFNIGSTREVHGDGVDEALDIGVAIRIFDVGLVVGGGFSFPVGDQLIFLEGRYALGLANIQQDPQFSQFVRALELGERIETRGIQFMTGVSLLLD